MVKYFSFSIYIFFFCLKILLNVNGKATVWHTPLILETDEGWENHWKLEQIVSEWVSAQEFRSSNTTFFSERKKRGIQVSKHVHGQRVCWVVTWFGGWKMVGFGSSLYNLNQTWVWILEPKLEFMILEKWTWNWFARFHVGISFYIIYRTHFLIHLRVVKGKFL